MTSTKRAEISLPVEARAAVWRLFGEGASLSDRPSSYDLIESVVREHVSSTDPGRTIAAIRGWFELHGDQQCLKPRLQEPVAALILEEIRTERSETAIWAASSVDADRAASFIRSGWSSDEIDSFVEAALGELERLCDRDEVLDATWILPEIDASNARIPKSALVRDGSLETFRHLDVVCRGLHRAADGLIELLVVLRPEQFESLIARLAHPVMQARAASHRLRTALPLDHRTTLHWITEDSCDDLVALAIVNTLNTVNRLDEERRSTDRARADRRSWSTELRPPRDDLEAAAAGLLTGLVDRLAVLDPFACARWTGELLSSAPYVLHGRNAADGAKPHRIDQLERACTEMLARLARQSWSDEMLAELRAGLQLTPRTTWNRHIADVAWELREAAPDRAAEIARATLEEHERQVAEALRRNHLFLNWRDWHDREWIAGLGISLALSKEDLDLPTWVSSRCRALPLSVWDAEEQDSAFSSPLSVGSAEEDRPNFTTADRVAQHWFMIAFRALPALKQLGREIDPVAVCALADALWLHCRFAGRHLHGAPEDSIAAEHAARFVVECGEPSDTWLLDHARHPGVGSRALWALTDQRRIKNVREGRGDVPFDEIVAAEFIGIASERFDEEVDIGLEPLRFWGRLWLLLNAADAAQRAATAIIAFPQRMQDRADRILALKLLALAATKESPVEAIKDYIASDYRRLWPGYTPDEERADRQQIDELLARSEPRIL